jgi:hypothetical protein
MKQTFKTKLISRDEIDDDAWNDFINSSPQYCIYAMSWYLDAVCPKWCAIIIYNSKEWLSVFPFQINSKMGVSYSFLPAFTQYLGIFFLPFKSSNHRLLHFQKCMINATIEAIPEKIKVFSSNFSPKFEYFAPFTWSFYEVKPRITFILPLNISIEKIYENYSTKIKNSIDKAIKTKFRIEHESNIDDLLQILLENKIISNSQSNIANKLWEELQKQGIGFCLSVKNCKNETLSSGVFFQDKDKIVFLLLGTKSDYKRTGVTSLLIHSAIKEAKSMENIKFFDFEGSMLEGVENYFRGFNPSPVYYFNIEKNKIYFWSLFYKWIKSLAFYKCFAALTF